MHLWSADATFGPADDGALLEFYGATFARLAAAVTRRGEPTRYLAWQSPQADGRVLHSLGIEVHAGEAAPADLGAWQLSEHTCTRYDSGSVAGSAAITWDWTAQDAEGRRLGEFRADRPYWLSGLAPAQPGTVPDDAVTLVPADPTWPAQFQATAAWLRAVVPAGLLSRIEHYGSTAVPGLVAKPVLDVALEVPSFAATKPVLLPLFSGDAWEYWWHGGHMVLVQRERPFGRRTHHLHVAPAGHRLWDGLLFRDWLIAHPDDARRYAELKRELASALGDDRERYTLAKGEFVAAVTRQAKEAGRG